MKEEEVKKILRPECCGIGIGKYPCPIPDWGACQKCEEKVKKICQLFEPQQSEDIRFQPNTYNLNNSVEGKNMGSFIRKPEVILECCGKPESECRCKEANPIMSRSVMRRLAAQHNLPAPKTYPKIMSIDVCYEMRRRPHEDIYFCKLMDRICLLESGDKCEELVKMREEK